LRERAFFRWTGMSLLAAGALSLLINTALTPFLPREGVFAHVAASPVFLWRQSASAICAALLLFGSLGVYLRQDQRARMFGAFAFVVTLIGTALLLATEWSEIFLVRDMALRAPDAFRILDSGKHPSLYDLGAMIPLIVFTIGWITLAASTLLARVLSRAAAWLVIAGFFSIPIMGAVAGVGGQIAGNVLLAVGWIWLGHDVSKIQETFVSV
jgi:hypothetical protein